VRSRLYSVGAQPPTPRSRAPNPLIPAEGIPIELSVISLLPPLLAIILAIATRQVYLSLAAGVWIGWTILSGWNPVAGAAGAIEGVVGVLGDAGNARVILFTLVIGALIATIESAGGVRGFVDWVEHRRWRMAGARGSWPGCSGP
jgi:tetracycline resistance efflux pump